MIYIVQDKKVKNKMDIKKRALFIIPELEERFNVSMSSESFENNDLPEYFYTEIVSDSEIKYTFEIDYGSAEITVNNFGSGQEEFYWNDILQLHIDNLNIID